jgi:hypothetical protein
MELMRLSCLGRVIGAKEEHDHETAAAHQRGANYFDGKIAELRAEAGAS